MFELNKELLFQWMVRAIVMFTALPVHEFAHAFVARRLGDDTAQRNGRLSVNPFVHLDLFGGVLLVLTGFGWAKPVPVDPRRFKNPRGGMALTAIAGPLSNILLGLILFIVLKILYYTADSPALRYWDGGAFLDILRYMLLINLYLAVFNLLPVPPLDGSKFFGALFPDSIYFTVMRYERYIAIAVFFLVWNGFLSGPLQALAGYLFDFLDLITRPVDMIFNGGLV